MNKKNKKKKKENKEDKKRLLKNKDYKILRNKKMNKEENKRQWEIKICKKQQEIKPMQKIKLWNKNKWCRIKKDVSKQSKMNISNKKNKENLK